MILEAKPKRIYPPGRKMNLPVGSIVVRKQCRFVKVRMTGPTQLRWMKFARWWWIHNRGPVPQGMRVGHLDGDSFNDHPANLALLTPGDIAFLAHDRDPAMSERNFAAMRKGVALFNREHAQFRRMTEWLRSKWYPVDIEARKIFNKPVRQRWQIYAAGLDASPAKGLKITAVKGCDLTGPRFEGFMRVNEFHSARSDLLEKP